MCAFAVDQVLCNSDLQLLQRLQHGDGNALGQICDRFRVPIWARLWQATLDFDQAKGLVEQVLVNLGNRVARQSLPPAEFAEEAITLAAARGMQVSSELQVEASGLEGLQSVPRVIRRRIVRKAMPQLPLPRLTALMLMYLEQKSAEQMVGLVADNRDEVEQTLADAHEALVSAIREHPSASEGTLR